MGEGGWVGRLAGRVAAASDAGGATGFRLARYFTFTSLVAFGVVGLALFVLQRGEESYFAGVQREQVEFVTRVQDELLRKQVEAARANLIAVHQVGHVNLARVFANVLWASDLAPFVERVQQLPVEQCRAIVESDAAARRACFAELGARIRALPGFAAIDAKAHATMRETTVFKIKVFDWRGIVVYSSEHAQIGDDARANRGWISAAAGKAASELTHRDRFSAFEGVVENRDLISSYLPVRMPGSRQPGVFEIYSDVTPLLEQIRLDAARSEAVNRAHRERLERAAADSQREVEGDSNRFLLIIGALLVLLYLSLLVLVRYAQSILDRQAAAQEQAMQREANWHRERMAALATMAASVSHEVGNPLAIIAGVAEGMRTCERTGGDCPQWEPAAILEQTTRIGRMMRQIADFAAARSEVREVVDLNQAVKSVCDFLGFDQRLRDAHIQFRAADNLPACIAIPDHLNEVLMTLMQACPMPAQPEDARSSGPLVVTTRAQGTMAVVTILCPGGVSDAARNARPADARLDLARRRAEAMGGWLTESDAGFELALPAATDAISSGWQG